MPELNPFDLKPKEAKEDKIFLVKLGPWEWSKTETVDDEPEYDFNPGGRLFVCVADCPFCGCEDTLQVCASAHGDVDTWVRDYCCLSCGEGGNISGRYGEGELKPRDEHDDHYFLLPSHVVIEA